MRYLILILTSLFIFACATTKGSMEPKKLDITIEQSDESPIDPVKVAEEWTYITSNSISGTPVHFYLNPDEKAGIGHVCIVVYQGKIFRYTYLLKGTIYLYFYNEETKQHVKTDAENVNQENWLNVFRVAFNLSKI